MTTERAKANEDKFSLAESAKRLADFAKWTNSKPPKRILADDKAPSPELLRYCELNNCSLDWVFRGDLEALFRTGRKKSAVAMQERLDLIADVAGVEPLKPERDEEGEILITQSLLEFIRNNGADLNWLFAGEEREMLKVFLPANKQNWEFLEKMGQLDEAEQQIFMTTVREMVAGDVSDKEARETLNRRLDEYNRTKAV